MRYVRYDWVVRLSDRFIPLDASSLTKGVFCISVMVAVLWVSIDVES